MSQENTNQKLVNYISRIAAEAGAAKAIEIYQAQEAERIKDNEKARSSRTSSYCSKNTEI